jgi:hypothetical protein
MPCAAGIRIDSGARSFLDARFGAGGMVFIGRINRH